MPKIRTVLARAGNAIVRGAKAATGGQLGKRKMAAMQGMERNLWHLSGVQPSKSNRGVSRFRVDAKGNITIVDGVAVRKYDSAGRLLLKETKTQTGVKEIKYSPPGRFIGKRLKGFND